MIPYFIKRSIENSLRQFLNLRRRLSIIPKKNPGPGCTRSTEGDPRPTTAWIVLGDFRLEKCQIYQMWRRWSYTPNKSWCHPNQPGSSEFEQVNCLRYYPKGEI